MTDEEFSALLAANTVACSPPLCPEITLRLLRPDAPLWHASDKHLFDDAGLRPYWAFCWASGQALARYLLDHPDLVRGRRVVDFGSGSGVAAIAAAMAGAAAVVATEIDPLALRAIAVNAGLNHVAVTASGENLLDTDIRPWDVLLASDVCYWSTNSDWLGSLREEGKLVLVADPGRPGFPRSQFEELARYAVRTVPEIEHHSLTEAAVYRLP
jgi:predicted nicotinamide N-methyase